MELSMIEVLGIAKHFAKVAGWGFFKLTSIHTDQNDSSKWIVVADLGGFDERFIEMEISDLKKVVIKYGPWTKKDST